MTNLSGEDPGFEIIEDQVAEPRGVSESPWKLLVVDDDEAVHSVTRIALSDFRYLDRGLKFLHAYSGEQAREMLCEHDDIALVLLDVVMETDTAGLDVARFIREDLKNPYLRVVLRTGQAGQAPEREVVTRYDINDYKHKTELTRDRLYTVLFTGLSSYRQLRTLQWQSQALSIARAESARIAYAASHQLREPLLSIRRFADLLRKRYADKLDDEGRELVDLAVECVLDMNGLMADLATLTSVEGTAINFRPLACDDLLYWALRKLKTRGLNTAIVDHPASLPAVQGDHAKLIELFLHLLENALKFSPRDKRIEVSVRESGENWEFSIVDRGPGIPQGKLDSVFDAFSVAHDPDQPIGNGIGLAIARKIVHQHGGHIHAEPEDGGGTRIIFTLPGEKADPARNQFIVNGELPSDIDAASFYPTGKL